MSKPFGKRPRLLSFVRIVGSSKVPYRTVFNHDPREDTLPRRSQGVIGVSIAFDRPLDMH